MKILAIASGGGHWQQLMLLRDAFRSEDVTFLTTQASYAADVAPSPLYVVTDANRDRPLRMLRAAFDVLRWTWRVRPDVVVTTGAAPGFLGVVFGRLAGARTVWIDSIANAEKLSMSGRFAARFADVCLTQWGHLARTRGPQYEGAIL